MMLKGYDVMNETKICLLGGDTRQITMARRLAQSGFETAVWGLPHPDTDSCGADPGFVRCTDPCSAVCGCRAVILPLPATSDGIHVRCTCTEESLPLMRRELRLTDLMEMMPSGCLLLSGMPGEVLRSMARDANIPLFDYYDCETVQLRNAIPTAEGALALAMEALPVTLYGAACTILGYGRIGRRLAGVLQALGAQVTVAARSERDRCSAEISGCRICSISDFLLHPGEPDVIFNTVPVPLLDAAAMKRLPASALYMELASAPGGIEAAALRECRQRVIRAPSLPGRVAPVSAGEILAASVLEILRREGVSAP